MKFALSTFMTSVGELPEIAVAAEEAGWSMITMSDHVANLQTLKTPYPYTPDGKRRWPEFTEWPDQLVGCCQSNRNSSPLHEFSCLNSGL